MLFGAGFVRRSTAARERTTLPRRSEPWHRESLSVTLLLLRLTLARRAAERHETDSRHPPAAARDRPRAERRASSVPCHGRAAASRGGAGGGARLLSRA